MVPIRVLVILLLGLSAAVLSGLELWRYLITADLQVVGRLVDKGNLPGRNVAADVDVRPSFKLGMASCLDDLTLAGTALRMARVDQVIPRSEGEVRVPVSPGGTTSETPSATDYIGSLSRGHLLLGLRPDRSGDVSEIRMRADAAAQTIDQRLGCSPMDGNAWLNRAIALELLGAPSDKVLQALMMSYAMAPGERWVIQKRLRFVMTRLDDRLLSLSSAFALDSWRYVAKSSARDNAQFYIDAAPTAREIIAISIRNLDEIRQLDIRQQVDRLGATLKLDSAKN